jgi:hypothetical protein
MHFNDYSNTTGASFLETDSGKSNTRARYRRTYTVKQLVECMDTMTKDTMYALRVHHCNDSK